jgi:hypothetical protein
MIRMTMFQLSTAKKRKKRKLGTTGMIKPSRKRKLGTTGMIKPRRNRTLNRVRKR